MPVVAAVGYQSNWVDILQTSFMRHAFVGGTLVVIAPGLLGYFVVVRQSAFAAHALAHVGFPGATAAILLDRQRPASAIRCRWPPESWEG